MLIVTALVIEYELKFSARGEQRIYFCTKHMPQGDINKCRVITPAMIRRVYF